MDFATIALAALVVGIPIAIAVLMLVYPVATLIVGGILVVYAGGIVTTLSTGVTISSVGAIGSLVAGLAISVGIGLMVLGFVMIGTGGILAAVLRAHRRQIPLPELPADHVEAPPVDRW
ncbi:MAG: hypothetical protein ACTSYE_05730 [Alphaproteobacteria bacterium]